VIVTTDSSVFAGGLAAEGSLLALDVSKRRIGVAGTDLGRCLVTPLETVTRKGWAADMARIEAHIGTRQAAGLVIGWPLNMDGSEGRAGRSMRGTAHALAKALDRPILLQDERLTSEAVRQAVDEGRLARPKRGEPLDHYAAAVILEDALRRLEAVAGQAD